MEFAIQVDADGNPVNHPISLENLRYIYGEDLTLDNLPDGLEKFVRVTSPQLGPYEVLTSEASYARVDGVLQNVFETRPMTDEEKAAAIDRAMNVRHPPDYVFDYDKCAWRPVLNQPGTEPNVIG